MEFIRQHGLEKFLNQQRERIRILEDLLKNFDDGKSKSYFCLATTLLSIKEIQNAVHETRKKIKKAQIDSQDAKAKSKTVREFLEESAAREGIELKLRKKEKVQP